MFGNSGLGLADIAAVTGGRNDNGGGWGNGDGWWVLIILFALFGGWGNGGYGNNGGGAGMQGALTRGDLCMDMNFNGLENAVGRISDNQAAIARQTDNAICTLGYNMAQLANGIQQLIGTEFRGLDNAICTLGFNMQAGQNAIQQSINNCCCENRAAIADLKYSAANNTRDIIENNNANTRAILDQMNANYVRQLENENQGLRLAASQNAQNQYLVDKLRPCPEPAYLTCNPWANQAPYGCCTQYNQGCCN